MRKLLLVVCALALAACSEGADSPAATDTGPLAGSIAVQASGGEGEINAIRELVASFQKANPGTTVTLVPVPDAGESVAKLTSAFAGGNPPDVFLINYRRLGQFASRDVIAPVEGLDTAGLYDTVLPPFTYGGKLMCLPQNASSPVVYVNTDLFAKAGVALPAKDWTFADVEATAAALAAKKTQAIGFDPTVIRLAPFVWSAGGEIVDNATKPTKIDLSSAGARKAIALLDTLQKHGLDATERAGQSAEDQFAAGKVAMFIDSRRAVPGMRKAEGLNFDVAPFPRDAGLVSVLHSDGYCVSKASKNLRLARAFAAYAVSPEGGKVLAETGRTVPSVKALAESAAFLDPAKEPKSSQVFLDAIPHVRALPNVPKWDEAESVADDLLEQYFAGRLSLDDAIRRIAEESARELAP